MNLNILPKEIRLPEKNFGNTEASAAKESKFSESALNQDDTAKNNVDESKLSDFQKKIKELIEEKKTTSASKETPDSVEPDEAKPDEIKIENESDKISINISLNNLINISNLSEKVPLGNESKETISDLETIFVPPENKITMTEEPVLEGELVTKTEASVELGQSKTDKASLLQAIDNDKLETAKTDIPKETAEPVKIKDLPESKESKSPEKAIDNANNREKESKTENTLFNSSLKDNEKADTKNLSEFPDNNHKKNSDTDSSERKIFKGSEAAGNISKGQEFSFQPSGKIETNQSILTQDKNIIYHTISKQIEDSVSAVLSSNRKEIKIDMSPPDLGSIKIEVITNKHKEVAISIVAKDVDVKFLIDTNKTDLLNNMAEKGVFVKEFSVSVGGNKNWNQKWRENLNRNSEKRLQSIDSPVAINNIASLKRKGSLISFDGKVDVYV